MGKPKINNINPQNRKVKLVYLREQLKAIVEFNSFTLKKVLDFVSVSTLFTQFLLQYMSRSNCMRIGHVSGKLVY